MKTHKGGRTEQVGIRATPELVKMLAEIKQKTGKSAADLLEEIVQSQYKNLK